MVEASWYDSEIIQKWDDLMGVFQKHSSGQWVFRAQSNASWSLETTLERAYLGATVDEAPFKGFPSDSAKQAARNAKHRDALRSSGVDDEGQCICADKQSCKLYEGACIARVEGGLLREFQRRCHHYQEEALPNPRDYLEWFALMRHYSAPTRLLDGTYSFFVAAFFALADNQNQAEAAIWAIDCQAVAEACGCIIEESNGAGDSHQRARLLYSGDQHVTKPRTFRSLYLEADPPFTMVGVLTPRRLNRRLTIQQGTFLCPGNITVPFENNLRAMVRAYPGFQVAKYVLSFDLAQRKAVIRNLLRMNISWATLYPGLQGFAQSLETRLVDCTHLEPDTDWHVSA